MGRGKRKNIVVEMWVYLNENLGISHTLILSNSFVCFVCSFVSLFVCFVCSFVRSRLRNWPEIQT